MATVLAPALFVVVGLGLYGLIEGKLSEVGRLVLFVGLFWLAYLLCRTTVHV